MDEPRVSSIPTLPGQIKGRTLQTMTELKVFTPSHPPTHKEANHLIDFLHDHLDQYGDPKEHIKACLDYALQRSDSPGGFAITISDEYGLVGATIVNATGMKGYIPEFILVYIATHRRVRGKGIGKQLLQEVLERADGDVALHVEPDNPARILYEKAGFQSKYLEMRLKRQNVH